MPVPTAQLDELQRRLAELTTVQRVARAINSTLDLDAIFLTVVRQINMAFNYQMVSIYLREGDGLRLQAYLGYEEVIEFINVDLALDEAADRPRARRSLDRIAAAAQGAADLTRQLLAYAGKGRYVVERTQLDPVLSDAIRQLRPALSPMVDLRYIAARDLPEVQGDLGQIRQAVINLVLNAAEACGPAAAEIVITAGWERIDPAQIGAAEPPDLLAGKVILVIDDEDGVRNVAARLLERAGWSVLTAADGRAGIDVFQANAGAIGCVLLDLTMPHMSGEQVFHELRRIQPDARIVLCSGYSEENATSRFARSELAGFLHKPFTPEELRSKIEGVLGADER